MNYDLFDFLVLSAVRDGKRTVQNILGYVCERLPCPPSYELLCFSLSSLVKDRFVEVCDGSFALAGEGDALFSCRKKLFESKDAYLSRLRDIFTDNKLTYDENERLRLDENEYVQAVEAITGEYVVTAPMSISRDGGKITFLLNSRKSDENENDLAEDELEQPSKLELKLSEKRVYAFLRALGEENEIGSGTKKLCIPGVDASYVLCLCRAKQGIRITVQKILFNRQRFFDKKGGELDYAQCGDALIDFCVSESSLSDSLALILSESRAINTERS